MKQLLFLLLLPMFVSAQTVTFRSPTISLFKLDNGRELIGYYDASSTDADGWDSVAYLSGRVLRLNMANIVQYDLYTAPISVSSTSIVNCNYLITDINASAASGNVTITLNPTYAKQVINVKRTDASSNTLTVQMASGTIEGASTKVFENIQNMNYQLRWDSSTNTTSIR